METQKETQRPPLAQMEDPALLRARYQAVSGEVLAKWAQAVTGTHREAMLAVLREREARPAGDGEAPGEVSVSPLSERENRGR